VVAGETRARGRRRGRALHSFTLELNLSNSGTLMRDAFSWVIRWMEELKMSWNVNECKPLRRGCRKQCCAAWRRLTWTG